MVGADSTNNLKFGVTCISCPNIKTPNETALRKRRAVSFCIINTSTLTWTQHTMKITFKEYLIEYAGDDLQERFIYGGVSKVLKHLKYWFDGDDKTTEERIDALHKGMEAAGGPSKFAIKIRRIPSVRHWMKKHAEELPEDLSQVIGLI